MWLLNYTVQVEVELDVVDEGESVDLLFKSISNINVFGLFDSILVVLVDVVVADSVLSLPTGIVLSSTSSNSGVIVKNNSWSFSPSSSLKYF